MNDDATGATTTTASAASAASAAAPDITDAAASPAAARPQAATVKPETVKPPEKPEADPLFFSRLLRTQRLMEKDARAAKISSLSIV